MSRTAFPSGLEKPNFGDLFARREVLPVSYATRPPELNLLERTSNLRAAAQESSAPSPYAGLEMEPPPVQPDAMIIEEPEEEEGSRDHGEASDSAIEVSSEPDTDDADKIDDPDDSSFGSDDAAEAARAEADDEAEGDAARLVLSVDSADAWGEEEEDGEEEEEDGEEGEAPEEAPSEDRAEEGPVQQQQEEGEPAGLRLSANESDWLALLARVQARHAQPSRKRARGSSAAEEEEESPAKRARPSPPPEVKKVAETATLSAVEKKKTPLVLPPAPPRAPAVATDEHRLGAVMDQMVPLVLRGAAGSQMVERQRLAVSHLQAPPRSGGLPAKNQLQAIIGMYEDCWAFMTRAPAYERALFAGTEPPGV